jgi:membrane metallo-endopeptidase-like protein 1
VCLHLRLTKYRLQIWFVSQHILTAFSTKVPITERVVVSTPGYLRNLTEILAREPKRNVANYMMWRAARASVGFLNKDIRAIGEEFVKNVTGKTETPPRWKNCVGSAAGSFSAAIGKMYVQRHFKEEAKVAMLELVRDVREEFRIILDEVRGRIRGRLHLRFGWAVWICVSPLHKLSM